MKLKLLPKPPLLNSWNCIRFAKGPCGPFCILVTGARLDLATGAHPSRAICPQFAQHPWLKGCAISLRQHTLPAPVHAGVRFSASYQSWLECVWWLNMLRVCVCVWKEWRCNVWRYLIRSVLREEVGRLGWPQAKPPPRQVSGGLRDDDRRWRSDATALHGGREVAFMSFVRGGQVATTSNSIPNMTGAVRAGLGVGLLPQMVGRATPGLVLCFPPPVETDSPWWLMASPEAYQQPRVRSFMAFAAARIRQEKSGGLRT